MGVIAKLTGIPWLGAAVLWVAAAGNVWTGNFDSAHGYINLGLAAMCFVTGFVSLWWHYRWLPKYREEQRKKIEAMFAEIDRAHATTQPVEPQ